MQPYSPLPSQGWKYPQLSQSFRDTIEEALKQPNELHSCNTTAKHLKEAYEKVNLQKIEQKKIIYQKKQFAPEKCENHIFTKLGLDHQLKKAQMIRLPIHDLKHNYDHYVTIFKETYREIDPETQPSQKMQTIWLLAHSWENVYSLKNWVYDVDIKAISRNLCSQQFDPINHLRDFLGYYNEKWFYEFYKDRQHQKHNIFPRFEQIYSFNSNDKRTIRQVEWYTLEE